MDFKVNTKKLGDSAIDMAFAGLALRRVSLTVGSAASVLGSEGKEYQSIAKTLRNYQKSIDSEVKVVGNFTKAVAQISTQYATTERIIKLLRPIKGLPIWAIPIHGPHTPGGLASWPWLHGWHPSIGWPPHIGPIPIIPGIAHGILLPSILGDGWNPWAENPWAKARRERFGDDYWNKILQQPMASGLIDVLNGEGNAHADVDMDNLAVAAGAGFVGSIIAGEGKIGNEFANAEGKFELGKFSADAEAEAGLMKDGKFDPHASAHAGVDVVGLEASGKAHLGIADIEGEAKIGHASAKGEVSTSLLDKNGKFSPSIEAKASAQATAAEGKVKSRVGSADNNIHGEAEGKVLHAGAEAKFKASKDGIEAKAGAEAYVAKGSVKGGVTIMGIKIDAKVSGGIGGAGATAGGKATGTSVSGKLGLGLGVGGDVEISIDWSENTIVKKYNEFKNSLPKLW